jgi:hypothetical protein
MSSETTVVSAFYPLVVSNPKYSIGHYKVWLQNLCKIPMHLIIFTTETFALELYEWRRQNLEKTHVIVRSFDSFAMTCPSMVSFWKKQEEFDQDHFGTSELYAMWSLKQELVRIAINQNRFKSKWFCWCDVGIQRFSKLQAYYMTFPHDIERLCPPGRMTFLEVDKIPQSYVDDWTEDKPVKYPFPEITLGSGCIVGDADAWSEFGEVYKEMLKEFALRGWFAGKETSVFFAILMEKKAKPFRLFYAKQFVNIPGIEWLSFPVMLGGNLTGEVDTRFEPLET